jgi:hypothetical protein
VRPDEFGTVEWKCPAEKTTMPPGGQMGRSWGSGRSCSSGSGQLRVSVLMCRAALHLLCWFHSA